MSEQLQLLSRSTAAGRVPAVISAPQASPARPVVTLENTAATKPSALTTSPMAVVPFTDPQLEVWLGTEMGPEASCIFNEAIAIDLRGTLDESALERAVHQVVDRHEALRMIVSREPLGLRIKHGLDVALEKRDLSTLASGAREQALDAAMRSGDIEPFDLERGPLLRMKLLKTARDQFMLLMTAHHLVCDGLSASIVLRDLAELYSANTLKRPIALETPLQASEFAQQILSEQSGPEGREAEAYWLSQFSTVPDPLEMPIDRPRPAIRTSRGARAAVLLDRRVLTLAKDLSGTQRATLFATLLAAYEVLIHRLSGQDDFVVGIPIAGQDLEGRDVVAHRLNFVPLRCRLNGATSFRDHLAAVQRNWFDVDEHKGFTYQTLLAKLPVRRDLARNTLMSVSFTSEPALENLAFHGLQARSVMVPRNTAKREMHLNAIETAEGLLVLADFNRDLFDESTVERWIASYGQLIKSACTAPDTPIAKLDAVTETDRRLLKEWNSTASVSSDERLIHQLAETWARQTPDAPALVCEEQRLSWSKLNRRANQLARTLARHGVVRGDRVAICLERSSEFVVALLASFKAGAAYVPLDPAYPPERLAFLVRDAGARAVIATRATADVLPLATGVSVVRVDGDEHAIARESGDNLAIEMCPDDLAYVMYTSGTTGQPKGVAVEHRQLSNYTWAVSARLNQPPGCSYAMVSTVAADLGNTSIFPALATGGTLHVITSDRAADGRLLAEYFDQHGVDVLKITPTHLGALLKSHHSRSLLPRRCLVLGGESAHPSWVAELQQLAPDCTIFNHYGPTETTVGALTFRVPANCSTLTGDGLPLGRPLGNLRAYVLDAGRQLVPIGVPGELFIAGAGVARGYLNRDELTADRFVPDPFSNEPAARMYRTGDRARWNTDGQLEFLGRADNQVKVRGFRLELGEIESLLRSLPKVDDAVVLLRRDSDEPQLVAYVSGSNLETGDLRERLKKSLPSHAIPAAFVVVSDWPLTPNGKLDRRALPAPSEQDRVVVRSVSAEPSSPTERRLAKMWCDLLKVSRVGMSDDFFLLGGHSLVAMRLIGLVHREFGVALHQGALFRYPVFADLAGHIDSLTAPASPVPARSTVSPDAGRALEAEPVDQAVIMARLNSPPAPDPGATRIDSAGAAGPANVLVRIAEGGPGAPFYWVHGVGGEVFSYMALSRHLATERPVYGFTADWSLVEGQENATLEVMARHYANVLRSQQPIGPYHIGGFCSAAMLALEVARQLEADGGTAGVLAVIDYDNTPGNAPQGLGALVAFFRNLPRWLKDDAMASGFKDFVGRVASRLRRLAKRVPSAASQAPNQTIDFRDQIGMWRFPAHQVAMLKTHHHAIHTYQPKPFKGRVSLFLPRTHPLFGPWPTGDDRAWSDLAGGGVSVHEVRGSHSTMLTEPFASGLAATLMQSLRKAEAAYASDEESRRQSRGQGVTKVLDLRLKSATTRI